MYKNSQAFEHLSRSQGSLMGMGKQASKDIPRSCWIDASHASSESQGFSALLLCSLPTPNLPPFCIAPNHHYWNKIFLDIIPSELMHPPSLLDGHNHHLNPLTLWSLSGRQGTILAWVSRSLSPNSGHTNLWPVTWASWQLVHSCTIFLCSLDDQFRGPNLKEKGHLAG